MNFAMLFTKSRTQLTREFPRISKLLAPAGMFWISWPKKSSGALTDLNENIVREIGLSAGLVNVKVCAVTEVWSGLKFVRRIEDRDVTKRESNSARRAVLELSATSGDASPFRG